MVKYWINDISRNIEAVFLKLGAIIVHHKRNTMTPLMSLPWQQFGHWCCLNKIKIPSFCLKPRTIYPTRSIDGSSDNMGAVSAPSSTLFLISAVANGDICFLDRKRLEPKELLWQHHWRCHFVSFLMHIYGAKFQEHCFNISRDIIYSVFYHF